MINTVFPAFNFRPASPKNCTSLSNNVMISCEDLANIKISFANLKAGFTDGTHVQLTVADWLQLGGGVERKASQPTRLGSTSDYSDRLHLLHRSRRRDHPGRACTSLPSVEERHSAKLSKWTMSFSAQSVEEPVTPAPPRVRQLPAPPGRQTTLTFPDGPPETKVWRARAGRKVQERRARAAQAQDRVPDEGHPPKNTTQRSRESTSWR